MLVESRLHFFKQCGSLLAPKFIGENPYLMSKFAVAAYHDGNAGEMLRYLGNLNKKMNKEPGRYPELLLTAAYINGLDFRRPMRDFCKMQAARMPKTAAPKSASELRTGTITQNMPFFHRSMRDFSEYHELLDNDLATFREVGKIMLSDALNIAEKTLVAGILYERGELLETIRQAPNAYNACTDETHPETVFSAHMMLSAVLYAMGAFREADEVMKKMETYIEKKAGFLRPNFKALQTERAIRAGNIEAAREWLEVNAYHLPGHLPFYQICRHFTTLRSYIAIGDFETAIGFGRRLLTLAMEYNRPLDQIESGLLTAIVLWKGNKQDEAVNQIKTAISTAMPYGFTQLFINEGKELLPLFWALREKVKKSDGIIDFTNKLTDAISKKYNLQSESDKKIKLTAQQHTMLTCLSKDMSYAEIADATGIERSTVKYHTKQMYKRLGVHTAQEALIKAKMLGLLD